MTIKNKHLSRLERIDIEKHINLNCSFKQITRDINRDYTTVSKEIKTHFVIRDIAGYGKSLIIVLISISVACSVSHVLHAAIPVLKDILFANITVVPVAATSLRKNVQGLINLPMSAMRARPKADVC